MIKILYFLRKYFLALLSCIYLFSVGFLFGKNRPLITKICEHFGFRVKKDELAIPKIKLSEIIKDNTSLEIHEPLGMDGNISLLEILVINNLITNYRPDNIFEIGTFNGRTTINMAANSYDKTKIYTLDLPKIQMNDTFLPLDDSEKHYINKNVSGIIFLGTDFEQKIVQLKGDSALFDFSPFYNSMDFIFIDGSHSYEYVLNDSKISLKLLKNGSGIIIWHDYGSWRGVTRALDELYKTKLELRNIKHIEGTTLAIAIFN